MSVSRGCSFALRLLCRNDGYVDCCAAAFRQLDRNASILVGAKELGNAPRAVFNEFPGEDFVAARRNAFKAKTAHLVCGSTLEKLCSRAQIDVGSEYDGYTIQGLPGDWRHDLPFQ